MSVRHCSVLLLLVLLITLPARAQDDTTATSLEPIVATDVLRIRQLGDVALSPDRRTVVYTVREIVEEAGEEGEYTYRTQLFMVPASGREAPQQLTFSSEGASQPAWRPDSEALAFVRPVEGTPQVFVMPLYGGEAYQLTDAEHGATSPRWSPDGERLLYATSLPEHVVYEQLQAPPAWPIERPGRVYSDVAAAEPDPNGSLAEVRAWLAENADEAAPRVINRLDLQGEHDLEPRRSFRHFYVVEAAAGAEPQAVTRGFYSFGGGAWLPDGQRVVVSGAYVDDRHPDRVDDSDLFVAYADSLALEPLLDLDAYAVFDPQVTSEGDHLAFRARRIDDPGYAQTELGVMPLQQPSAARLLTLDFDRSVGETRWAGDNWHLYFTAPSDGGYPLFRVTAFPKRATDAAVRADSLAQVIGQAARRVEDADSLDVDSLIGARPAALADSASTDTSTLEAASDSLGVEGAGDDGMPQVERLTGYARGVRSFDVSDASVYYVLTQPSNPYELFAASLGDTNRERRLTRHNAAWLEDKRLSVPVPDTLVRADSTVVPFWVMKPSFFEEERTYPLLLEIHGGPMAMWGPGEATMWHEFQFFASQGYGIVFSNPRGSGGYGYAYKRANYQDWGAGPAGDVLAAASEAAELPWIDPEQQVVTGGSYAGYLIAWIVGHDHRFQAAVAQRGVYDLVTFLGEGNAWRLVPSHFGGYPWETITSDTSAFGPPHVASGAAARSDTSFDLSSLADVLARAVADTLAAAGVDTMLTAEDAVVDTAAVDTAATASGWMIAASDTVAMSDSVRQAVPDSVLQPMLDGSSRALPGEADGSEAAARLPTPRDSTLVPVSVRDILLRESPLTYADQIRTPLLIMHSDDDLRTGVIQSEMLYKTLKILERPVEYVRYPNSGHDLSRTGDPRLRIDRLLRIYEFFERYIDHEVAAAAAPSGAGGSETEAAQQ